MLDKKTYFIRQHTKFIRSSKTYDIIDPDTQEHIAIAQEKISMFMVFLRLLINKMLLPIRVNIYGGDTLKDNNNILFSIRKGVTFLRSKVTVYNEKNEMIGWFKTKAFSFKIAIRVFNKENNEIALIKGDWKGWNFNFTDKEDNQIGQVTKKWAGVGKELFTQSDNYVISLNGEPNQEQVTLLLAAGLSIDLIYKSGK